jgi:hypothetical protein
VSPARRAAVVNGRDAVAIVAIVAIASLEGVALATGRDGVFFSGTLALIGSIVGVRLGVKALRLKLVEEEG